jgi:hypothetical protein
VPFRHFYSYPYTDGSIKASAPEVSGVYGIYARTTVKNEWIYVGQSENIQKTLIEHLQAKGPEDECIQSHQPTGFTYETVPEDRRLTRHNELILELGPHCNKKPD